MNSKQLMPEQGQADITAIRLLLIDDHPLIRKALRGIIEKERDITIIGEGGNGEEAVELAQKLTPNVIIMDVSMPKMDGIEAMHRIKDVVPQVNIIILTVYDDEQHVRAILEAGAAGYLLKSVFGDEVVRAIRSVAAGNMVLSPSIGRQLVKQAAIHPVKAVRLQERGKLSPRELEVLKLTALGLSNKEIASQLELNLRTVKGHFSDIFSKLCVNSRTEAVMTGLRDGFLSIDDVK
jgi:NarL family two-component system response regulator LiaR